jgi:RecA-family ATPase
MQLPPPTNAQDFAEEALPHPRWIVDRLLPGDGWTLLVARPKTGKSLLALMLAGALQGGTFLGRHVVEPGKVLYVQVDAPAGDWQEQVRLLPEGRREWDTYTRQHLPMYALDPANATLQAQLRDRIAKGSYRLVILDALEKLTKQDINTKEGCQGFIERLRIVSPGPTLVIHHPRKPHGDNADNVIDSAAGHHYLTGDASAIWGLAKNEGGGVLKVQTRGTEDQSISLRRLASGLWELAPDKPKPKPILDAAPIQWGKL